MAKILNTFQLDQTKVTHIGQRLLQRLTVSGRLHRLSEKK